MEGTANAYQNLDSLLLYWGLVVGGVADSHQCVNVEFLQLLKKQKDERRELEMRDVWTGPAGRGTRPYLGELVERGIGGVVGDEELHASVGDLYCGGAIHVGETA